MGKSAKVVEQYSSDDDSELSQIESSGDEQLQSHSGSESDSDDDIEEKNKKESARVREQLADVPFDQLIRIQQQMGQKKPNRALGQKEKSQVKRETKRALKQQLGKGSDSESDDSDSDDSGPETVSAKSSGPHGSRKEILHRETRKMPTMMSSKRPVSRFRQVVDISKSKTRDPRFDSLSGNFNEDLFEKSYEFLEDQQRDEISDMKRQLGKLKDKDGRDARRIKRALESVQSQLSAKEQKKRNQELKRTHRKMETEAVEQGKRPYFLGKRDLKDLEVAQKFNKLKGTAKLDKFMEKRRKRNANKDHRNMPYQRRDD
ncbi:rRNA biogenesis protein rrp36 [Coemansia sp. RSA 678]|nr:rRNA biogenesis protein rrp36 [Coemansia sp. RSA 678]